MTHGFLDQRSLPESVLRRTDSLWKTLLFVVAAFIVASEPRGELMAFGYYGALVGVLAVLGRVRPTHWLRRCLAAVPFLALASVMPFLAAGSDLNAVEWSASILLRGFAAVALLSLLVETTEPVELVDALQRLRLPAIWISILALAYRYIFLLMDEWQRVADARACRAPVLSGFALTGIMTQQLGLIFIRSWERAERIHGAMMARGFSGTWPISSRTVGSAIGLSVCSVTLAAFIVVRVLL